MNNYDQEDFEEIKRQIEFYFSDNTMEREDLMRNAIEVDYGYVAIDLLLTFPKLQELTWSATIVQKAIKNSVYLLLSDDCKRIRRLAPYKLPNEPRLNQGFGGGLLAARYHQYWQAQSIIPESFMEALQSRKFISAKKFFKSGILGEDCSRDAAEMELLRKLGNRQCARVPLNKDSFLSPSIYNVIRVQQASVLLLWTVFPRLLLTFLDRVNEPSIFQQPDWEFHWKLALQRVEQGFTKIDNSAVEVFPRLDFPYAEGVLCVIAGVKATEVLLLASIFCVNPRIIIVHDEDLDKVYIKHISMSGNGTILSGKTTYRMKPVSSRSSYTGEGVSKNDGGDTNSRTATPDEVGFLLRLRPELRNPCLVNWSFYCRELLESIEKIPATDTFNPLEVYEMDNADYSLAEGDLLRVDNVDAAEARVIACAICSSRIIVVHDKGSTIWIKDLAMSGPLKFDGRRTTYRVLPPPEGLRDLESGIIHPPVTAKTISTGPRAMTEEELKYLRALRWRGRLPALVVAARFRSGAFFHVLKMVATFL